MRDRVATAWTFRPLGRDGYAPSPRVPTPCSEEFVPKCAKTNKRADGSCKLSLIFCKMACNRAEMSPFVSGKLSFDPLFSYTFPDRPSYLTSFGVHRVFRATFCPSPRPRRYPASGNLSFVFPRLSGHPFYPPGDPAGLPLPQLNLASKFKL